MHSPIVWPTIAMAALIFAVWAILLVSRFRHVRHHPPTGRDFADGEAARQYFRDVERPALNLANLSEMPILFFALVPLLLLTGHASAAQCVLAWSFVALRTLHSVIHIHRNRIRPRMRAYVLSCAVLSAMWIGWTIDLFRAASGGVP